MQIEITQQKQQQHTQSIPQAMEYLQELPTSMREEVFHFIDFMRMRSLHEVQQESETPVKKRHAGTAKGKAIFADNTAQNFSTYLHDWREKNKDILTDDDDWADVRDRNDFGRETSCWEE